MENKIIGGNQFNQKYKGTQFVKITNQKENHNGYQFKTWYNVDSLPFNLQGNCEPQGIYFVESQKSINGSFIILIILVQWFMFD